MREKFLIAMLLCMATGTAFSAGGICRSSAECKAEEVCDSVGTKLLCVKELTRESRYDAIHWGSSYWDPSIRADRLAIRDVIQERVVGWLFRFGITISKDAESEALSRMQAFNRLYKPTDRDYEKEFIKHFGSFEILLWEAYSKVNKIKRELECIGRSADRKQEALCWVGLIQSLESAQMHSERFVALASLRPDSLPQLGAANMPWDSISYVIGESSSLASSVLGGMIKKDLIKSGK